MAETASPTMSHLTQVYKLIGHGSGNSQRAPHRLGSLDALLGGVALPGPTYGTQVPCVSLVHSTLHKKSLGI